MGFLNISILAPKEPEAPQFEHREQIADVLIYNLQFFLFWITNLSLYRLLDALGDSLSHAVIHRFILLNLLKWLHRQIRRAWVFQEWYKLRVLVVQILPWLVSFEDLLQIFQWYIHYFLKVNIVSGGPFLPGLSYALSIPVNIH